jgi:hypothetical protein
MSSIQEFAVSAGRKLMDTPIEQKLAMVGIFGLIAAFVIIRRRFNVKNARRLSAALAAYTAMELAQ